MHSILPRETIRVQKAGETSAFLPPNSRVPLIGKLFRMFCHIGRHVDSYVIAQVEASNFFWLR